MNVITVTNQKGGVGKTAIALHLAFAARDRGQSILLVDLDSQGNATLALKAGALPAYGGAALLFNPEEDVIPTVTGEIHLVVGAGDERRFVRIVNRSLAGA